MYASHIAALYSSRRLVNWFILSGLLMSLGLAPIGFRGVAGAGTPATKGATETAGKEVDAIVPT